MNEERYQIIQGDVRERLAEMPSESVHMVCTSPPYWSLRDYGTAQWQGGDKGCDHKERNARNDGARSGVDGFGGNGNERGHADMGALLFRGTCGKCGATRVDNQLGLEATPAEYIEAMVQVFEGVRRVLRRDGLCFVNIGDSYWNGGGEKRDNGHGYVDGGKQKLDAARGMLLQRGIGPVPGLKAKSLCLIPQRLAISLQDAGWWVRSIIIWDKSNPMPESVTDRPTTSHEYVLMLAKSERYFYDGDAIREPHIRLWDAATNGGSMATGRHDAAHIGGTNRHHRPYPEPDPAGRNKRTVWRIPSAPFPGSHFATFPPALVEPMIRCGTSERGCCAECGAPWRRVVERGETMWEKRKAGGATMGGHIEDSNGLYQRGVMKGLNGKTHADWKAQNPDVTTGWTPTCTCPTTATVPATVLDPFCGAATTLLVALRLGRRGLGIELNPEYIAMSHKRIAEDVGANQMRMVLEA